VSPTDGARVRGRPPPLAGEAASVALRPPISASLSALHANSASAATPPGGVGGASFSAGVRIAPLSSEPGRRHRGMRRALTGSSRPRFAVGAASSNLGLVLAKPCRLLGPALYGLVVEPRMTRPIERSTKHAQAHSIDSRHGGARQRCLRRRRARGNSVVPLEGGARVRRPQSRASATAQSTGRGTSPRAQIARRTRRTTWRRATATSLYARCTPTALSIPETSGVLLARSPSQVPDLRHEKNPASRCASSRLPAGV
jgi:hypothetical protein